MIVLSHNVSYRRALVLVTCVALLGYWPVLWLIPAYYRDPPAFTTDPPIFTKNPLALFWNAPKRAVPEAYWRHRSLNPARYKQLTCSSPPSPEQLQFAAAGWQLMPLSPGHLYIYGAHWDDRFQEPLVRVLVYCDVAPLPELVCLLWYEDEGTPDTVKAGVVYAWSKSWGGPSDGVHEPYILSCPARRHPPSPQRPPAAVSIVLPTQLCTTPTNILNVQGVPGQTVETSEHDVRRNSSLTPSVCVCLKWIHYSEDISAALVEWIEFLREFGAKKLFTFVIHAEPNTRRVLSHYEASGFVDATEFSHFPQLRGSFTGIKRDFLDFRRELLPLNDCLYRARASACDWITPLDIDEIIAPHANYSTWQQVINATLGKNSKKDSLMVRHYYFLDTEQRNITQSHMRMMSHIWRARLASSPAYSVKSFHNTSSVVGVHNHVPMVCERPDTGGKCVHTRVHEDVARVHHYRLKCNRENKYSECPPIGDTVPDMTLARHSDVTGRVERVLRTLNITPR